MQLIDQPQKYNEEYLLVQSSVSTNELFQIKWQHFFLIELHSTRAN